MLHATWRRRAAWSSDALRMPTRRERRAAAAAAAAAEPSPPTEPFFMRLIGAPVVRKMLGIPFGKMGQCASPAKLARHARYPVSPIAAINAWAHIAGYLHESVSVVDVGGCGLGFVKKYDILWRRHVRILCVLP